MANPGSAAPVEPGGQAAFQSNPGDNVAPLHRARPSACVVIPARDEAAAVADVVADIRALGLTAIVVDDYSADATVRVAREAGATVLQLPFHAGSWAAIQTGIRFARASGFYRVITVDADGQHDPADIATLIERLDAPDGPNVVIGACPRRANRRRRLAWRALRWLSGLDVEDLTSGFRAYDSRATALLADEQHALLEYQDVGVLLCLKAAGLRLEEIPVDMRPRRDGISRIFSSWPMVAYYLVYSALIGSSRRFRRYRESDR
jgi:hypothetical protein